MAQHRADNKRRWMWTSLGKTFRPEFEQTESDWLDTEKEDIIELARDYTSLGEFGECGHRRRAISGC